MSFARYPVWLVALVLILSLATPMLGESVTDQVYRLMVRGEYSRAEALLKDAVARETGPEVALLYQLLGDALEKQKKTDEAVLSYRHSSELYSEPEAKADCLSLAAYAQLYNGRAAEALVLFKELNTRFPTTTSGLKAPEGLADSLRELGCYEEADAVLVHAVEQWKLRKDSEAVARCLVKRAGISMDMKQYEQALEWTKESLALSPSVQAYLSAGQACELDGKLALAARYYQEGVEFSTARFGPEDGWTDFVKARLGTSLSRLGKYTEAVTIFESLPVERFPERFYYLSRLYSQLGSPLEALDYARLAVQSRPGLSSFQLLTARTHLLSLLVNESDMTEARELEERLLSSAELPEFLRFEVLLEGARLRRLSGNFASAASRLDELLLEAPDGWMPRILLEQASLLQAEEKWSEAERVLLKCGKATEKHLGESHPLMAEVLQDLGWTQMKLEKFEIAAATLSEAVEHHRRYLGTRHLSTARLELAVAPLFRLLGKGKMAEEVLRKSLPVLEQELGSEARETIEARIQLGSLLRAEEGSEALALLEEAHKALVSQPSEESRSLKAGVCLALAQKSMADKEKARRYLQEGLAFADGGWKSNFQLALIGLQIQDEQYEEAKKQARELLQETNDPLYNVFALELLASAQRATKEYDEAFQSAQLALDLVRQSPLPALELVVRWSLVEHYLDTAQPGLALSELERVLELENQIVGEPAMLPSLRVVYSTAIETLLTLKEPERALRVADDSLARSLREIVRRQTAGELAGIPAHYTDRLGALESKLESIQKSIDSSDTLTPEHHQNLDRLVREEETLQSERERLVREITTQYPAYAELLAPQPLDLRAARRTLGQNKAVLLYFLGPRSFLFLLTDEHLGFLELDSAGVVNERCKAYSQALSQATGDSRDVRLLPLPELADLDLEGTRKELGQLLIEPIKKQGWLPALKGRELIVVPTESLWMVPFETLPGLEGERYLVQERTISYTPSISLFLRLVDLREKRERQAEPVLLGGCDYRGEVRPLPYSELEIQEIARAYPGSKVFTGSEATEVAFKTRPEFGRAPVLHFAAHGVLGEHPALLLTPTDDSDGRLEMKEIMARPIEAKFVTLSACSSGRGWLRPGEGVLGLSRAFMHSGASSVVVSLWNVNDQSTCRFMQYFYHALKSDTVSGALRAARLRMIEDGASPGQWAPFVVVGAP